MTVSQANDVTDDGHDGSRAAVSLSDPPPLGRTSTAAPQLSVNRNGVTLYNEGWSIPSVRGDLN